MKKTHLKALFGRVKTLYRRSDRFFHLLVGLPSYDKYVEHIETHHPGQKPKSRKQFFKECIEKKYGAGGGTKCC